jgi:phage FluMu protein Com
MTETVESMVNVHYDDEGKLVKGIIHEARCTVCNKLLYRMVRVDKNNVGYTKDDSDVKPSDLINGFIECKCPRCKAVNHYTPNNI